MPRNENEVKIGPYGPNSGDSAARVHWAHLNYEYSWLEDVDPRETPFAYFMHECCWCLAKMIIGSLALENNLGLFIAHLPKDGLKQRTLFGSEYESFLYGFKMDSMVPEIFFKDPQMHVHPKQPLVVERLFRVLCLLAVLAFCSSSVSLFRFVSFYFVFLFFFFHCVGVIYLHSFCTLSTVS